MYIAAVAIFLRFYDLPLKPLHHDEAVNGLFLAKLVVPPHTYRYDPANYHGPTLYYAAWLGTVLVRSPTVAIRCVTGVAGLMSVLLMLAFRRSIGSVGAVAAASLLAVSPGAVYFSRYFIHEMLLVCFTIGFVAAMSAWLQGRGVKFLCLAAASVGLMFATKETAVISAVVLIGAFVGSAWLVDARSSSGGARRFVSPPLWTSIIQAFGKAADPNGRGRRSLGAWALAAAIFIVVNVLFYSSFFVHLDALPDAVRALAIWTGTGSSAHRHPWYTYLSWLAQEEMPLLLLGAAGVVLAIWKSDNRFAVFTALWSLGTLTAYSVIPYKTPWLSLNIIAPLAICGGYAAEMIWRNRVAIPRAVMAGGAAAALLVATYQSVVLNFVRYDDNNYPYVYAHTSREVLALVEEIRRIRAREPKMTIAITSDRQFPLSWYLRDYPVGYYGRVVETNDSLVIGSDDQEATLDRLLSDRYAKVHSYQLRPGVALVLYARRDVVGPGPDGSRSGATLK